MAVAESNGGHRSTTLASIDQSIEELRRFPRGAWLDLVRSDQSQRWRQGAGILVEDYFTRLPELRADPEEALVLITGELLLRREVGETLDVGEYQSRFPEFVDHIAVQFCVDDFLSSTDGADAPVAEHETRDLELAGYEFLEEIGRGAAGVVYKARQTSLGRFVAIKVVVLPGADAKQLARQRQEAEILARLHHPNVVHIYEVRDHRGCLHLVMEYVEGKTLSARVGGNLLTPHESAQVALTLAGAVQAVHEAGVLHRDLKPSNVLTTAAGELKISDFGLAKLRSSSSLLTTTDSVLGTPSYMAPEQAMGDAHSVGPEADVYSLGAILYELLTGRPPFLGATVLDTLSLIRTEEPVSPRRLQPRVSRDLETICLKCLAKAPKQRYDTAAELANDLRRFAAGQTIVARRAAPWERLVRQTRRRPAAALAIVCCFTLVGVVAAAMWGRAAQQRHMSAESLAASIATADAQALPQLLDRLPQNDLALEAVRRRLAVAAAPDATWVNLAIAELAANPDASPSRLLAYLPIARPMEIRPIVGVLARRPEQVESPAWQMLEDESRSGAARLNVACVVAQISPRDARWRKVAATIVGALVLQHPLDVSEFTVALRPARQSLIPALAAWHGNESLEPLGREVAAGILARFAADQPQTLVDLIVVANAGEFRVVIPLLKKHAASALRLLALEANAVVRIAVREADEGFETRHDLERTYDRAQHRRANAMIAMWRLGHPDMALQSLQHPGDAALRAWLMELLGPLGVGPSELWSQVNGAADAGARQALLLAIGQQRIDEVALPPDSALLAGLETMYRDDPDAGVHAACEWLLRMRFQAADRVEAVDAALGRSPTPGHSWFLGPNGHCFSMFRGPIAFRMGSPDNELSRETDETAHQRTLEYSFAVAAKEVTIAQFLQFRDKYVNRRHSPTDDSPCNNVTWFDAAAYCRWLSEQEGLPEEQMCYPPVAEIVPGMQMPDDWLARTGYRLPTEAEWEYACRSGVSDSRFFGEGAELLVHYARFMRNSDDHAWPVGQLKPNNFGLFDMLGNASERCQDAMETYPQGEAIVSPTASAEETTVGGVAQRAFRGANFGDLEHNLRSARRNANSVQDQWALIGFRIARTL